MKNSFAPSLKKLFAILLLLNTIIIAILINFAVSSYSNQRQSLVEMGYGVLRAFEATRPMIFASKRSNEYLNELLGEMFDLNIISNIVIYNESRDVIFAMRPFEGIVRTDVMGKFQTETPDIITLYNGFSLPSHMMGSGPRGGMKGHMPDHLGRPESKVFIAVSINKENLNSLRSSYFITIFVACLIELLIFFLYFRMRSLIDLYHKSTLRLKNAEKEATTGRLASILAHEIKNPLSSMAGLIDFSIKKTKDEKIVDILSRTNDEIARLSKIVNDFLSYGRTYELELKLADLRPLVEKTCKLLEHDFKQKDLTFQISGRSFEALIDENKILQVFVNLILNAAEASPANEMVEIFIDGDTKTIAIKNQVAKIADIDKNKIFEPFFTTKTKGSGLGLSITKKIMEGHEYKIFAESMNPCVLVLDFKKGGVS